MKINLDHCNLCNADYIGHIGQQTRQKWNQDLLHRAYAGVDNAGGHFKSACRPKSKRLSMLLQAPTIYEKNYICLSIKWW